MKKEYFDERQKEQRGEAFKIAYFLMSMMVIVDYFLALFGYEFATYLTRMIAIILIPQLVFRCITTNQDSFDNENNGSVSYIIVIICSLITFVIGVDMLIEGYMIVDGIIQNNACTFLFSLSAIPSVIGLRRAIKYSKRSDLE